MSFKDVFEADNGDVLVFREYGVREVLSSPPDDINSIGNVDTTGIASGQILEWNGTAFVAGNKASGGSGEANTASNLGAGEGVFSAKSALDLQFKSLVAGTNISLSSDANTITINSTSSGDVTSVNSQTGVVVLDTDDISEGVTNKYVTAAQKTLIDNSIQPSDNISTLTNDAGYITSAPVTSVASKTGVVTLVKADITDFVESDYATGAEGDLAATALQPGANISTLTNDSGYLTSIGSIGSHTDVTITAAAKGDILVYNGSAWVDLTVGTDSQILAANSATPTGLEWTAAGAGVTTFAALDDTNVTAPAAGHLLTWDAVNSEWDNIARSAINLSDFNDDLTYVSAEVNDLTAAVVWANVPDANITQSSVTQHQAALSITESQISDLGAYITGVATLNDIGNVTITANSAGEILKWNGTSWVNNTLAEAGIATSAQGALADSATQPGDNISTLTNDANFVASGANISVFTNDSGYITGVSTLNDIGNVTITSNTSGELLVWNGTAWVNNTIAEAGLATSAQGALADSATQPGDNVSTLTNDANYVSSGDNVSDLTNDVNYIGTTINTVQTTDGTQTTLSTIAIPTDGEKVIVAVVKAKESATGDRKWRYLRFEGANDAGTASLVGGVAGDSGNTAGAAAWDISVSASGSNILIQVTGEAAHTIDWSVTYQQY